MNRRLRRLVPVAAVCGLLVAAGCARVSRRFAPPAGGARGATPLDMAPVLARYERNASALANGKRLFGWYNCNGCHANGGGGSGPALMDDVWLYGSDPVTIYQTIVEGRPNGMPAFGGRVPDDEIWQLVAYVRSMSGLASQDAAPNRDDALYTKPAENQAERGKPVRSGAPGHP